jgi:predicted kinase
MHTFDLVQWPNIPNYSNGLQLRMCVGWPFSNLRQPLISSYSNNPAFASDHSRVRYLRGYQADPLYQAYDDTWGEVTLLAGLPGVGKDRWITRHGSDQPLISLDIIRGDLGIDPSEPQGLVVHYAKAQARNYLRNQQSFIWNATNLTRQLRDPLIDLFLAYHARVRVVYLDAPLTNVLARNQKRRTPVPHEVILRLAGKADPPTLAEAHRVEWLDG